MALWLKSGDADFEDRFKALLALKREQSADVNDKVASIIAPSAKRATQRSST